MPRRCGYTQCRDMHIVRLILFVFHNAVVFYVCRQWKCRSCLVLVRRPSAENGAHKKEKSRLFVFVSIELVCLCVLLLSSIGRFLVFKGCMFSYCFFARRQSSQMLLLGLQSTVYILGTRPLAVADLFMIAHVKWVWNDDSISSRVFRSTVDMTLNFKFNPRTAGGLSHLRTAGGGGGWPPPPENSKTKKGSDKR